MNAFRSIPPQINSTGWTVHDPSKPLPRGLEAGIKVTVVEISTDRVVVRDPNGAEWSVAALNVDCGYEFEYFGRWIQEWCPGLLNCFERELLSDIEGAQFKNLRRKACEEWVWKQMILLRNGRSFLNEAARQIYERVQEKPKKGGSSRSAAPREMELAMAS